MSGAASASSASSSAPGKTSRPSRLAALSSSGPSPDASNNNNNNSLGIPPPALHLTVRFSTSLPDLHLDILTPHQTTVAALKHLIRTRLASTNDTGPGPRDRAAARGRIRFIHGGKILPDGAVLSSVLKALPPPPPAAAGGAGGARGDGREKGKGVEGRAEQRVYVNCSIGDELSDAELAAEAQAARTPAPAASSSSSSSSARPLSRGLAMDTGGTAVAGVPDGLVRPSAAAARTPRGFDRLLQTGFTPAEVNQLRLQFRSIQASRHTPDTMPSPDSLRLMEDAWIDNNNGGGSAFASGGTGGFVGEGADGGEVAGDEAGMVGLLDVMVKGMLIGFMFPLGTAGWLIRQEAMWSRRWRLFATLGFILSLTIGLIRTLSGDK
ncbi:hypothetical protein P8C59_006917 [Phyllachora maydis]|uniref:Ubiquitin-like domain-containing protein n=1 Tax=Phyllachora maydis TaxID=1825666 RepID=A0AAD9MF04_9PEZI|nr:hypothetical protein P8C59_006917 [Phyllachora maydis]